MSLPCSPQEGQTALHQAVQHGHLATVQLLMDLTPASDAGEGSDLTDALVRLAVAGGHSDVTGFLVKRGGVSNALLTDRQVGTL